MTIAEQIAREFHTTYERLAPEFGYRTRVASAVPWDEVPEHNRKLMIATVEALIMSDVIDPGPLVLEADRRERFKRGS